jgi:hypothetical protein
MRIKHFTHDERRLLVNLQQHYGSWIDARRVLDALPYGMRFKTVNITDYLYEIKDRDGNGTSLGRRSPETEARLDRYLSERRSAEERVEGAKLALDATCRQYRALFLPSVPAEAGRILREADLRGLLGSHLLVVGTNAVTAYVAFIGGRIDMLPDTTDDFDLAWVYRSEPLRGPVVWPLLKSVDPTYAVNTERTFQARNSKAFEVEVLVSPSAAKTLPRLDSPSPIPLPEQEWLHHGKPLSMVVVDDKAAPARLVVPDPRWFALHKLWLADQAKRDPLKRDKDRIQGSLLLQAIPEGFPLHPLDEPEFVSALPEELVPYYEARPTVSARPADW